MRPIYLGAALTAAWMLLTVPQALSWVVPQPSHNIWVTLARTLKQDNLCLSMGNLDNPLLTCLVGIPLAAHEYPYTGKKPNLVDIWDEWTKILPQAPEEPQELDLLGSSKAHYSVQFYYKLSGQHLSHLDLIRSTHKKDVSPTNKVYNPPNWCNYTSHTLSSSSLHPKVLPRGVFLICGDRAWAGIPSRLQGGPCSLGQLTTLTPNITILQSLKNNSAHKLARKK